MVRVDVPEPVIVDGLKPPLVTPLGNPDSLPTEKLTVLPYPLRAVTVTVKLADCPGTTVTDDGLTETPKSGVAGRTVIVRVGGLGSELPLASLTVSEVTYVPAMGKVTFPGFCATEVVGVPPGKTHE